MIPLPNKKKHFLPLRLEDSDYKLLTEIKNMLGQDFYADTMRYIILMSHIILKSEAWKHLPPLPVLAEEAIKLKVKK